MSEFYIKYFKAGKSLPIIAGACIIEDNEVPFVIAEKLSTLKSKGIPVVYKASFDKANRSSIKSFRGIGLNKALNIIKEVKLKYKLPILIDVHEVWQIEKVSEVADLLQIPAFLCRQTDLVVESAKTGKIINVKKGQFISPWEVKFIIEKIVSTGNDNILITERGFIFGYQNLVVDMRVFPIVKDLGVPVIYDATHSVQLPGAGNMSSGGMREFIEPLAFAAIAAGACGIYMEVHPEPENSPSDKAVIYPLDKLEIFYTKLNKLFNFIQEL